MPYICYLIIPLVIAILFALINKEVRNAEKNMNERNFVVRQSKFVVWIGIICIAFFGALIVLMTMFPNDTAQWWVYFVFALFVGLGLLLTAYGAFWKLRIAEDTIIFSAMFRKTKTFTFSVITNVNMKDTKQYEQIIAYSEGKKLFAVESNCRGYDILVARLIKEQIKFG